MMQSNPEMQALMESNPELRNMLQDPEVMRQSMQMMRDPSAMQNMLRQQDLAMSNIENMPGGFNALRRMYTEFQEPMMDAMGGGQEGTTGSNSNSNAPRDGGVSGAVGAAMPNPWGDNPQLRAVTERINSSNPTKRQVWSDTNAQMRRTEAWEESHQYDITNRYEKDGFTRAYDAFIQNHASSPGLVGESVQRDFWRQQWLNKTDEEI